MSNEIKEKEEYEKYARDHRKELDAQEVKIGDVVKVLVGQFAGETGIVVGIIAFDEFDYTDPYYEIALNCDVPEKYKCRKTLITPNNVAGGFTANGFKVIGNRAPIQPSNEIKVGDKVRVREDAPEMYFFGCNHDDSVCKVIFIDRDEAVITQPKNGSFPIPLKYLVKVEDEKKEPRFKVNDVVRTVFNETTHVTSVLENGNYYLYGMGNEYPEDSLTLIEPYTEPTEEKKEAKYHKGDRVKFKNIYELQKVKDKSFRWMLVMFASKEATITAVEDNGFYRVDIDPSIGGINDDMIECKVEPTEQTEVEKPNVGSIKIPVEVDLTDSFWDAYTADLAKEIAVKVANKYSDPKEAGEYAVRVAEVVVAGLKKK